MAPLVTIGIPVYKRLKYLPQAIRSVSEQDYPHIELIVSDNGMNGDVVSEIVTKYYSRPFRLRQNTISVSGPLHYNQIIEEAFGEYFVLLCDDDEISTNYVSELVGSLERNPSASVAISKQEVIDEAGVTIGNSEENIPEVLSGGDFIRAWCSNRYRYECFVTNVAKTHHLRMCGGFADFRRGLHSENALLTKLCMVGDVAFNVRCIFRWRMYKSSQGGCPAYAELGDASRQFLRLLDRDPVVCEFGARDPEGWRVMRRDIVKIIWGTYYYRWNEMYRKQMAPLKWVRAAFRMPFIPGYYKATTGRMTRALRDGIVMQVKARFPKIYQLYRGCKGSPV